MLCRFLAQAASCFAAPGGGVASTVTLTLQDSCAGCADNVVALPLLVLSRLAPVTQAAIPVTCQPRSNIEVVVEGYSLLGPGWLRLHLEQVGGSGGIIALWLRSTAASDDAASWRELTNVAGTAAWELSGVPPAPLDLLIQPADGAPLVARAVVPATGATGTFATSVQVRPTDSPSLGSLDTRALDAKAEPASEAAPASGAVPAAPAPEAVPAAQGVLAPAAEAQGAAATAEQAMADRRQPVPEPAPEPMPAAAPVHEPAPEAPTAAVQTATATTESRRAAAAAALAPSLLLDVEQRVQAAAAQAQWDQWEVARVAPWVEAPVMGPPALIPPPLPEVTPPAAPGPGLYEQLLEQPQPKPEGPTLNAATMALGLMPPAPANAAGHDLKPNSNRMAALQKTPPPQPEWVPAAVPAPLADPDAVSLAAPVTHGADETAAHSAPTTASAPEEGDSGGGSSIGLVVGAAVGGGGAAVALAACTCCMLARRRRPRHNAESSAAASAGSQPNRLDNPRGDQPGKPGMDLHIAQQHQHQHQLEAMGAYSYHLAHLQLPSAAQALPNDPQHQALDYVLSQYSPRRAPIASTAKPALGAGKPPLPPVRTGAREAAATAWLPPHQQHFNPPHLGASVGSDLLSSREHLLMFQLDAAGGSYRATDHILESSPWLDPHFPHPQSWQPQPVLPLHQSPPQPAFVSGSAQAELLGSWTPHPALPCQASRADRLERPAGGIWQGGSAAGAPLRSTAEYGQLSLAEQHRRQLSLLGSLQENELWSDTSPRAPPHLQEPLPPSAAGLPTPSGPHQFPPHSPTFSLDSMQSQGEEQGGSGVLPQVPGQGRQPQAQQAQQEGSLPAPARQSLLSAVLQHQQQSARSAQPPSFLHRGEAGIGAGCHPAGMLASTPLQWQPEPPPAAHAAAASLPPGSRHFGGSFLLRSDSFDSTASLGLYSRESVLDSQGPPHPPQQQQQQ
ncbi:hypothetical protein D9Q98_001102 [Chlorella vulgaris]|uniref:Expansin-like CBD domain-containing protein n=1 Tax=Chlorella vulgaris TaxID=3077 RepID=A0A9D4Z2P6_CHLVU|nr:hypothetical protein D9Q98_001102 [Chlorella vulgaris]